ncbi:HTH-type transcriptional regulator IscR [Phycisphaerae bacterium RAS1]|nr:HTH-type transcriptional regulator IscR [Phycisphaerae bacterium RAS1]
MLSLTRKSEYALIAVCHLARAESRVVSAREIAAQHHVPLPLLMNVLKVLGQAGIINSVRGARGGYSLSTPAEALTLSELIEAVEGPVRLVRCGPPHEAHADGACDLSGRCLIKQPVLRIHEELRRFLAGITLAEIAFDEHYVHLSTPAAAGPGKVSAP